MKITDYGLWFRDDASLEFAKKPSKLSTLYINGFFIGSHFSSDNYFAIYLPFLNEIGFKLNPKSPGKGKSNKHWHFPPNYLPSESDFEEIP